MNEPPSCASHKRARGVSSSAPPTTPSPSRRRRRRLTGSSPGCVPRPTVSTTPVAPTTRTTRTTRAAAAAVSRTPSLTLRTPPPRRLLPPSSASGRSSTTRRTRRATPLLRLDGDDDNADDDQEMKDDRSSKVSAAEQDDGDGSAAGDDAFSVISGDGSPERDRHVLEFLSFNSLADGTSTFSLFTPSPGISKEPSTTRSIASELIGGVFTPPCSPLRARSSATSSQSASSPSRFFRSPFRKSRDNSRTSSPASVRHSSRDECTQEEEGGKVGDDERKSAEDPDHDMEEREHEPEPRNSATRSSTLILSPRTPQRLAKSEPMHDVISVVCRPATGSLSSGSTPSSSSNDKWRRNSLSLLRTPSPAASARAKALQTKARAAQLLRPTPSSDPFGLSDEDADDAGDLSGAPSGALHGAHDQDWFFSFANTLSPLAAGVGAHEDELETSFLTLKFSPMVTSSSIDLQRLLPPFPSPGLGPTQSHAAGAKPTMTPTTPIAATSASGRATAVASAASSSSSTSSSRDSGGRSSISSSGSRELNESFPNIRASTSATPGRDERMKVSSSSVMKMKLHVTFDQFPPSHTKREIDAINNSLKRKKYARKRKLDEHKLRQGRANGKGLNVQRKLLQTPVKDDSVLKASKAQDNSDAGNEVKERPLKTQKTLHAFNGRATQRRLLITREELGEDDDVVSVASSGSAASSSSIVVKRASTGSTGSSKNLVIDSSMGLATPPLRRRLSPTFGSVSATPTLPLSLVAATSTPNLHPLRLRKSPAPATSAATATASATAAGAKSKLKESKPAEPVKVGVKTPATAKTIAPSPLVTPAPPHQPAASSAVAAVPTTATPVKTPMVPRPLLSAGTTPLSATKGGFVANAKLLATPVHSPATPAAIGTSQAGALAVPKKKSPCNCKKSKCLKLYCECFASGGYCDESCNCVGCANTPANEPVRQQAIASRLEKNPNAFKPKIETTALGVTNTMTPGSGAAATATGGFGFTTPHGNHQHAHAHLHSHQRHSHAPLSAQGLASGGDTKKMHKHGCHCKKSACQKRYCECFQAGVPCGDNCRCIDCKNQSPYATKTLTLATPQSAVTVRGPGAKELVPALAATPNQDSGDDPFVSPTFSSIRQRLRIDRETWARNFSSPFEVSPRRERERTERFRTQLKNSRASALLRSFNATQPASTVGVTPPSPATRAEAEVTTATATATASSSSSLSFRVHTTASFTSPPGQSLSVSMGPRSLSPLSDASRPPPAPTPPGEFARRGTKRSLPRNAHAMEALAIGRETPGRVYVLPLFGDDLPPVKSKVSATIFHFLTNADVYNASLVNRLWSRVTMGDTVWDHSNFRRVRGPVDTDDELATDGDVVMQS